MAKKKEQENYYYCIFCILRFGCTWALLGFLGTIKAAANLELTTQIGQASTQTNSSVVQPIASAPGSQGLAKCTSW